MQGNQNEPIIDYKDKLLWWVGYPAAALAINFIANGNTLAELLRLPSFYTDLVFAFGITFSIGLYLRWITRRLDRSHPWHDQFRLRLIRQFCFGVLLPLTIAMLLEAVYLLAIKIPLTDSTILNLELPIAFLLLLLANLFYLASYLFYHRKVEVVTIREEVLVQPVAPPEFITVQIGFAEERLPIADCAVIESRNKLVWVHTFSGESFRLSGTLEEWTGILEPANFFRINRQYLVAPKAIQSVETTSTRKLKLNLVVPAEDVFVSKLNVTSFRQWWNLGRPS